MEGHLPRGQQGPAVARLLIRTSGLRGNGRGADRHCQEGGAWCCPRPLAAAHQVTAGLAPSPLQYFVFDFHVSPDVMFDKIIKISVSGEQPPGMQGH